MERFRNFLRIFDAFERAGVEYVLVGGVAVIFHGLPRPTEDVDIFIKMYPANVEKLRQALRSVYDDPHIDEITFEDLQTYPVIRYGTPEGFYIDIMARLGDVAEYDDLDIEMLDVSGTIIRVATPETLYKLKKDTVRPKDRQDAMFLRELIKIKQRKSKEKDTDGETSQ